MEKTVLSPPDVLVSLQVPISANSMAYLELHRGEKTAADKLAGYVRWFIERQVGGGIMIEPADMEYIAGLNAGKRFESSRDVVKAVEVALKREDGQYSFTIKINPTLIAPLEECAGWQGLKAQELLEMIVNEALVNNWAYDFVPANGRIIPMDEATVASLSKALGITLFTGADIAKALAYPSIAKELARIHAVEKQVEEARLKALLDAENAKSAAKPVAA